MSSKMVIGMVGGLVVGLGAGWLAGGPAESEVDRAAEQLAAVELERDAIADEKAAATSELEDVKRRIGRLDRELSAARSALVAAEAEAAAAQAELNVADVDESSVDAPAVADGPGGLGEGQVFSFPEYDEHLAAVNWTDVGVHVGAMAPLLSEVMDAVSKGEQPSPQAIGGIQQHNGPLVTIAMTFHTKLPGETVNGAFTHPSAVVNVIAVTLDAMGKPLSEAQRASIARIGNDYVAEEQRRVEGYTEDSLAIQRQADESLVKGRFYDAAMAALTDEQHTLLRPAATRGRVTVDLFSASLVWVGRAQPIPFKDRAHLAEILGEKISRDLDLEGPARERLVALVATWVSELPTELVTREPDALWLKGLMPIDVIDLSAAQQVVLMTRMLAELELPEEAARKVRNHAGVFVPTWRPSN